MANSLNPRWQLARISLLALLLAATVASLVRAILVPPPGKDKPVVHTYEFPPAVPLSPWQPVRSQPLAADPQKAQNGGYRYQYQHNGRKLEVAVRYERYTEGNISRLLNSYTPIEVSDLVPQLKYQEGIGFYLLFQNEGRAYLSACLNPIGESTVTEAQFTQNRYKSGWGIQPVLLWAIGQRDLLDGRCFWTLLSTPIAQDGDDTALEGAYQTLESAWSQWYGWWRSQL